jgi:hypothetical protein
MDDCDSDERMHADVLQEKHRKIIKKLLIIKYRVVSKF